MACASVEISVSVIEQPSSIAGSFCVCTWSLERAFLVGLLAQKTYAEAWQVSTIAMIPETNNCGTAKVCFDLQLSLMLSLLCLQGSNLQEHCEQYLQSLCQEEATTSSCCLTVATAL